MTKKELLEKCDFNPLCKSALDYYLWAQLANYKIYYINEKLTYWRIHQDSYINRDKHSWLKKYLFNVSIYACTIKNRNKFIRLLLILNYMRARLIYLKLDKKSIKLNLLNHRFIFEKKFENRFVMNPLQPQWIPLQSHLCFKFFILHIHVILSHILLHSELLPYHHWILSLKHTALCNLYLCSFLHRFYQFCFYMTWYFSLLCTLWIANNQLVS